jgi:streptomycin 6-kinase
MDRHGMELPDTFRARVSSSFDGGSAWLERLPDLLAECERRWHLRLGPPFELSYNYAAPASRIGGGEVVVKVGVPCRELFTEIAALRLYDGDGCVKLLDADVDLGVLLLERLSPGAMLSTLGDDEAMTRIAARLMRRLWRPLPESHVFPTVAGWAKGFDRLRAAFDGETGPFPAAIVARAEAISAELLRTSEPSVMLHGDLHHFNILSAEREPWLVIDPKGVTGEPAYEVGALIRNPGPEAWTEAILGRRFDILAAELGIERERLVATSFSQAVLSAWWSYENHAEDGSWLRALPLADVLAGML